MNSEDSTSADTKKPDDTFLALIILAIAGVFILFGAIYLWRNRTSSLGLKKNQVKSNPFTPPPQREDYLNAKAVLDISKPDELDQLRQKLIRRALNTIPLLISLQNEGHSIQRLYKRGMLTDDMHFRVEEVKAFVDQEFQDVQQEAEDLQEGWGAQIWQQAMQFYQTVQQQKQKEIDDKTEAEEEKKRQKKEKEKAKKAAQKEAQTGSSSLESTTPKEPEIPIDPEERKIQEAERMAQQLLEEEERAKNVKPKDKGAPTKKNKSGRK